MKFICALVGFVLVGFPAVAQNASHYGRGDGYWGKGRACGGIHRPNDMTTAHKTLPCGTKVRLTNVKNGKSVVVTVMDRGPFVKGREWDVNSTVADQLGMGGLGQLHAEILGR